MTDARCFGKVVSRLAVALAIALVVIASTAGEARADGIAISGTWGTCPWEINSDGTLTVYPGQGDDIDDYESPWSDYASQITSVVFACEGNDKVVLPKKQLLPIRRILHGRVGGPFGVRCVGRVAHG